VSSRPLLTGTSILAALALAACGGSQPDRAALPRALGQRLAATADRVAAELEAGDAARARERAFALRAQLRTAIAAGAVPAELRAPLRAGVARLLGELPKPSPPPEPPPPPAPESRPPPAPPPAPAAERPPAKPHGKALGKEKRERKGHGPRGKEGHDHDR
jgi:hypothetical protein